MTTYSFERLRELVAERSVNVVQIAVLWGEARLVHPPSPEHALIALPATLHLAGRLSAVVYAEMPVAVGSRVRPRPPRTSLDRIKEAFRERRKAALLGYRLPDLGLFWQGEGVDGHALALARHFAQVLAEEFPDAQERLAQHFHVEPPHLVEHLSKRPPMHAAAVPRDKSA